MTFEWYEDAIVVYIFIFRLGSTLAKDTLTRAATLFKVLSEQLRGTLTTAF